MSIGPTSGAPCSIRAQAWPSAMPKRAVQGTLPATGLAGILTGAATTGVPSCARADILVRTSKRASEHVNTTNDMTLKSEAQGEDRLFIEREVLSRCGGIGKLLLAAGARCVPT